MGMADIRIKKDQSIDNLINRTRTASLTVNVKPPVSGTVTVGNKETRLQNGTGTLSHLSYGPIQVQVSAPGFEPIARSIDIKNRYETLNLNLEIQKFEVSFQIVPPDATLSVDGEKIKVNDQGFAKISSLSAKQYCYSVSSEGYENRVETFNPTNSQLILIELTPKDAFYGLKSDFFKEVHQIDNDFKIELWTNNSDFRIGDTIVFYFRAERDCYLNIVNINSQGELTLLFPNQFYRNNFIRAGRTYQIPDESYGFDLEIQPPAGMDRVYAIASNSPIDIFGSDFDQSAFKGITRGQTQEVQLRSIGVKLKNTRLHSAAECIIRIR